MALLIKGVQLVGAPGNHPERADVFISGEKISAIGVFPTKQADTVIEGQGIRLAPGFIDVHTESDHYLGVFDDPEQGGLLSQGITTMIGGQEGASLAPIIYGTLESIEEWSRADRINVNWRTVREFLTVIERRGIGVNFGTLVGHSTIRRALMGENVRDLTKNELAVFKKLLAQSIEEGAFGLSTGLKSVYGRNTPFSEIKHLVSLVAKYGGVYATALRKAPKTLDDAVDEAIKIFKETGARTIISNFMPVRGQRDEYERALEKIENLEPGFYFDVNPFETHIRPLYRFLPDWAQTGGLDIMAKSIHDDWLLPRIKKDLPRIAPGDFIVGKAIHNDSLVGNSLHDLMELYSLKKPEDALIKLMQSTNLRALIIYKNVDESMVRRALSHPRSLIAARSASFAELVNERAIRADHAIRTFPKFLECAVEENLMSLDAAIRKVTKLPADVFGLSGRGEIREGGVADLVGLKGSEPEFVIVGGAVVYEKNAHRPVRAGKPLRHAARRTS